MGFSLRFKIIFITVAILVLAIGATVIASSYIFAQEYADALQSRTVVIGQGIKSQLDRLLDLGIPLQELTGFEQQLQDTVNTYDDIAYAMILDLDGRILFHNDPSQQNISITDAAILKATQSGEQIIQTYSDENGEFQDVFIPILDRSDDQVGTIRLGFPTSLVTARINQLVILSGVIAIIFLMIAVALLIFTLSAWVTKPLAKLLTAIQLMRSGKYGLSSRVEINTKDELGEVSSAFNMMAIQLSDLIETLEQKVTERTRQLETVVEISQRLTGILDLSDLLRQVVTITKETFNYYHVHIYLLEGDMLVLAEGYGQAGIEMKRQGHSIPLGALKSLVAQAAREGRAILVEDVRAETGWLPNPLLPETRSEMAVPISLGTEAVGVLDVQSEKVGGLIEEDRATLETLANYVASAVRSARLFSQTQEALYEAQRLQQLYTGQAWEKLAATQRTTDYEFRHATLPPLSDISTPEVETALQQSQTVDLRLPAAAPNAANGVEGDGANRPHHNALATPLKLRGQTIGILGIHDNNPERRWTEDEITLIEAVSEQMSLAIENARLFEETGRRATREKIIADMTQRVWASGDLEKIMQTAVEQLGVVLDASEVVIRLGTETDLEQE